MHIYTLIHTHTVDDMGSWLYLLSGWSKETLAPTTVGLVDRSLFVAWSKSPSGLCWQHRLETNRE